MIYVVHDEFDVLLDVHIDDDVLDGTSLELLHLGIDVVLEHDGSHLPARLRRHVHQRLHHVVRYGGEKDNDSH